MAENEIALCYPILCLKEKDDRIYSFKSEKIFRHTNREILRTEIFKDVTIIDSLGNTYTIKNAKEAGWANSFWGYSLLLKGRQILVDFELESTGAIFLDEFKQLILAQVSKSLNLYESYGGGVEWIISSVNEGHSHKEVIEVFY